MSDESEAAGITRMAADAAHALTTVAAAEAEALVKVADAAHANLAPSVLVVSMFENIQRQMEAVGRELKDIRHWMAEADKRHDKMSGGIDIMSGRIDRQNGGVAKALEWMNAHDDRMKSEADTAKGRRAQRDDDLAVVRRVRSFYDEVWPLALAAVVGGLAVGGWFWSTLDGVPW